MKHQHLAEATYMCIELRTYTFTNFLMQNV